MISSKMLLVLGAAAMLASGCSRQEKAADAGMRKTNFPGMVTAGGGTSGEVMARAQKPVTDGGPSGKTAPPAAKQTPSGQ